MMRPDDLAPRRRSDTIGHVFAGGSPPTTTFAAAEILARRHLRGVIEPLGRPRPTSSGTLQGRRRYPAQVGALVARSSAKLGSSRVFVRWLFRRAAHLQPPVSRPDSLERFRPAVFFRGWSTGKTGISLIHVEG